MPGKCCAEQPPVSMGGSVARYGARKHWCCISRKQESIFESGAWTYISCNQRSTNFVFRWIIYRRERRATTIPGESKFFFNCLFSATVTKTGGWTTSLIQSSSASNIASSFHLRPIWLQSCTNFGCNQFRIMTEVVSKLLLAAIWSGCADQFKSEQTTISQTSCWFISIP